MRDIMVPHGLVVEQGHDHAIHKHGIVKWGLLLVDILVVPHIVALCYWLYLLWKSKNQVLMSRSNSRKRLTSTDSQPNLENLNPARFFRTNQLKRM